MTKKMKIDELTFSIREVDPPENIDFDLEEWLAGLLIEHLIATKDKNNKGENRYEK